MRRFGRPSAQAVFTWVFLIFLAGASDRVFVWLDLSYYEQIWFYRIASIALPFVVAFAAYRVCIELQAGERVQHERDRAREAARALQVDGDGTPSRAHASERA